MKIDYDARAVAAVACPHCGAERGKRCCGKWCDQLKTTHHARRAAAVRVLGDGRSRAAAASRKPCRHTRVSDIALATQWCTACGAWRRLRTKERGDAVVVAPAEWNLPGRQRA